MDTCVFKEIKKDNSLKTISYNKEKLPLEGFECVAVLSCTQ